MIKTILISIVLYMLSWNSQAQPYPEIGKSMPDFMLKNIAYYSKKQATLKDFKGKWLMLDFWNEACMACVGSFPRLNEMQKKFGDKMQIVIVGIPKPDGKIRGLFAKYQKLEELVLPCAFDSMMARQIAVPNVYPFIVLLDDKGIVRTITHHVDADDMEVFFAGGDPGLKRAYLGNEEEPEEADTRIPFDTEKPFLVHGNGGEDSSFLFRSLISVFDIERDHPFSNGRILNSDVEGGMFQVVGTSAETLFGFAYFGVEPYYFPGIKPDDSSTYGMYYPHLILETRDSSLFKVLGKNKKIQNVFNYSLTMPKKGCTRERMMAAMQRDLETYFGLRASIETRNCPYFKLIAKTGAAEKLKTKGAPAVWKGGERGTGFECINYDFKRIIMNVIRRGFEGYYIADATGISGNVDINLDYLEGNFNLLKKTLQANGLDFVEATMQMKALVISDSKN